MRHSYEEKLVQLQNKIRATQEERDKVLANLGGTCLKLQWGEVSTLLTW